MIAALRQLQISLAEIKSILDLDPDAIAERISQHWREAEVQHAARRGLAQYLVDHMQGKRHVTYEVDGPLEWCRPVPDDEAERLTAEVPELELRTEAAHREAFIHLGPGGQIEPAQWQLVSRSMHGWVNEHGVRPRDLGARVTYLADSTTPENAGPDCDFAIPIIA